MLCSTFVCSNQIYFYLKYIYLYIFIFIYLFIFLLKLSSPLPPNDLTVWMLVEKLPPPRLQLSPIVLYAFFCIRMRLASSVCILNGKILPWINLEIRVLKNSDNLLTPFWVFHILYPPPHEHQFSWNPTRPPPKGWANVPRLFQIWINVSTIHSPPVLVHHLSMPGLAAVENRQYKSVSRRRWTTLRLRTKVAVIMMRGD